MKRWSIGALGMALSLVLSQAAWAGQLKDGITAVEQQRYGDAKALLEAYAQRFPGDPRPHRYLQTCYEKNLEIGKVDGAIQRYRTLSEKWSKILQTLEGAEPASVYQAMLADDPADPIARMLLTASLLQAGEKMMAAAQLQALKSDIVPAIFADVPHVLAGTLHMLQREYPEARQAFKEAWRLNPNNPLPAKRLPQIDQDEKALQAENLDKSSQDPQNRGYDLTFKLAQDLLKENNFEQALDALSQALESRPDSEEAKQLLVEAKLKGANHHYQQGVAFVRDQKFAAAYEEFSTALRLDPTHVRAQMAVKDAKAKAAIQE